MPRLARSPRPLRAALIACVAAAIAAVAASCGDAARSHQRAASASVTVTQGQVGPAVPAGFLGFSIEYKGLEEYLGTNPAALDTGFLQLLRNLAPEGGSVLRIGGDSTDWSWWPVPGLVRPGGARYDLNARWAAIAKAAASAVRGRLILGLNFEADSGKIAAYEASQLLSHIGSASIDAFELGNEPELYAAFPWYKTSAGVHVPGRKPGYDVQQYLTDFRNVAGALPSNVPLAGPSSGAPTWLAELGSFVSAEPRVSLLTVHAYPTKHCGKAADVTAADLFLPSSLQGLAGQVAGWVRIAAAHHLPLRVDEMNSVSCGGEVGLSNAFAPALWALDMLPQLVQAGAAGVNFHTNPNTTNALLSATSSHGSWQVAAQPEYLGLLAFAQAAPTGSHFLHVSTSVPGLDAWAAQTPGGRVHVVLINVSSAARTAAVAVAGAGSAAATVSRLSAAGLSATSGVTLGGQKISANTGLLSGSPSTATIQQTHGVYPVTVPAASAAILTAG